jgi:hypothetical protein
MINDVVTIAALRPGCGDICLSGGKGCVKNGKSTDFQEEGGPDKPWEIRRCVPSDLRDIMDLQMKVWRGILDRAFRRKLMKAI